MPAAVSVLMAAPMATERADEAERVFVVVEWEALVVLRLRLADRDPDDQVGLAVEVEPLHAAAPRFDVRSQLLRQVGLVDAEARRRERLVLRVEMEDGEAPTALGRHGLHDEIGLIAPAAQLAPDEGGVHERLALGGALALVEQVVAGDGEGDGRQRQGRDAGRPGRRTP